MMAVTVCHRCGETLCAIPVEEAGERWDAAVKWGYIAQVEHDKVCAAQPELPL